MSVRFKFKNDLEQSTVPIDGFHISARDLKREIVRMKKFGRVTEFDLSVTNAQTQAVYEKDDDLIPKNSSLVVARHPLPKGQKKVWEEEVLPVAPASSSAPTSKVGGKNASASISGGAFATGDEEDASEEDKLNAMMANSNEMYGRSNWIHFRGRAAHNGQPPPKTYVCIKCSKPGHWHFDCPRTKAVNSGGVEIKRTTGIPRSFLKPADANTPGAKINPQGKHHGEELYVLVVALSRWLFCLVNTRYMRRFVIYR